MRLVMKLTARPRTDAPIANAIALLALAKQYPAALDDCLGK
jgi:hypothetical protein